MEYIRNVPIVLGVLAHVDAGKTTLAESILYTCGEIRKLGRVDHKDAFLDTDEQERERGITIFSKQAHFCYKDLDVTLLDTPGHVDFSAEMERTLQVLDYAVLIVSGADGIQGHTLTLWKLLERYQIPTFIFVNKMDQPGVEKEHLLTELKSRLDSRCLDFGTGVSGELTEELTEEIALTEEKLMEAYLEWTDNRTGECPVNPAKIRELVARRQLFPCFFGSALKVEGVDTLLDGLRSYTVEPSYGEEFGARVFKIARDNQGTRLTYVKVTGGSLKVKQMLTLQDRRAGIGGVTGKRSTESVGNSSLKVSSTGSREAEEERVVKEKVDQLRIYSGVSYSTEQEVKAGRICAITGPVMTFCGQGIGIEKENTLPILEPVMTYRIVLPKECDVHHMYKKLCQLEEEEPELHMVWKEQLQEIHAQLMGEVQTEVLRKRIRERFGVEVCFDEGSIVYKETIADTVEGVGHFEPLRHYAEVHLILEPGERGSGLTFRTVCGEDELDKNWQRLIMTHLEEKEHIGVLTGSAITDMQITLAAGRAHLKHTEGGDFRQATYRAVRQGLCKAQSILLEPVYEFRLELPSEMIGRGMSDIQSRGGRFAAPLIDGDHSILTGTVPVVKMHGYQAEVLSYSGGAGRLSTSLKGYEPCQNAEEVIEKIGYEAERDQDNPCGSVFCAHGAGFLVEWNEVEQYMHLESVLSQKRAGQWLTGSAFADNDEAETGKVLPEGLCWDEADSVSFAEKFAKRAEDSGYRTTGDFIAQEEIDEIFNRTFGTRERAKPGYARTVRPEKTVSAKYRGTDTPKEEYLLVDGYNIIFAWKSLRELANSNLDGARSRLMDILSNYQGYRKTHLILVFDAYKVKGNPGSCVRYHNIDVVYTREAETADQYIEKVSHDMNKKYRVRVATSDGLEQLIIMGAGAVRVSAREFEEEVYSVSEELRDMYLSKQRQNTGGRSYLLDDMSEDVALYIDSIKNTGESQQ